MEKAIFPMRYLNVSQGMGGSYSHKDTMKIDVIGSGSGIDNVFAPFTGIIRKIDPTNGNWVWLESLNPVKYADGTEDYMTIAFTHDNDISNLAVGDIIKQGEVFYQEGTAGMATGNHLQIDVGRGRFTGTGFAKNEAGQWVINNEIDPTKALWLLRNTIIINDGGYTWKVTDTTIYTADISNNVTYEVKVGDTLFSIARRYGISWQSLYDTNKKVIGNDANAIKAGQKLTMPGLIYYRVLVGDTLFSIARKFNTTWQTIYEMNKDVIGINPNVIRPGLNIIIKR